MRTIKFRGKSLYSKEWVYGYLLECVGSTEFITFDYNGDVTRTPASLNHTWILVPRLPDSVGWDTNDTFIDYEVDSETVGQFAGMKDKNGKSIYKDDIVSVNDFSSAYSSPYTGKVVMRKGQWCVEYYKEYRICRPLFFDDFADRKTEVVGNIYDNPELLKGGEE